MKQWLILVIVLVVLVVGSYLTWARPKTLIINNYSPMQLAIKNLTPDGFLPVVNTCDGEDLSPGLEIEGVPPGTKSLALIMDDPDAPAGHFIHWLAWNIAPDTIEIMEDSLPAGATSGTTSFGRVGYGGPCPPRREAGPPAGTHRYLFQLLALDDEFDLPVSTTAPELRAALAGHILAETKTDAKYRRQ